MNKHETVPVLFIYFDEQRDFRHMGENVGVCVHKFRLVQMFFPPGEIVNKIKPLFDQKKYLVVASWDFNPDFMKIFIHDGLCTGVLH